MYTSSYLNEASFTSTLQARCPTTRARSTRQGGQTGRGRLPAAMLDLECSQPAESSDFRGIRPHNPPAILPPQPPRVEPPRPPPPVDHDRLHSEFRRQRRQPPLARPRQVARVTHSGGNARLPEPGQQLPDPVAREPVPTGYPI